MKKPYLMEIVEKKTQKVIVWAEDRNEAIELTEKLHNNFGISMADSAVSSEVFCQFRAQDYDLEVFDQYNLSIDDIELPEDCKGNDVIYKTDEGNYEYHQYIPDAYGY